MLVTSSSSTVAVPSTSQATATPAASKAELDDAFNSLYDNISLQPKKRRRLMSIKDTYDSGDEDVFNDRFLKNGT
ncbi:hypothetical protein HDU97_001100 [Phlyctochytrium planicorne]|nr:hypothetical protein HDU97_001100 [Phlyctochytrium planicorne]